MEGKKMILNACIKRNKMVDEKICRHCKEENCRHAGELTTQERLSNCPRDEEGFVCCEMCIYRNEPELCPVSKNY
jgi:hypothetical protein